MQLLQGSRDLLLSSVMPAARIAPRSHPQPVHSMLLMEKTGGEVRFTAFNEALQLRSKADFGSGTAVAKATVSAHKFVELLRALPEADVSVGAGESKLTIKSGRSRYNLQMLPAQDFPVLSEGKYSVDISMPATALKHVLSLSSFAMASNDVRQYLNGLLLTVFGGVVRAVATDGHRLAVNDAPFASSVTGEALLPREAVLELIRLLPEGADDVVRVRIGAERARFDFGAFDLTTKLLTVGKFPDYERAIPANNSYVIPVDRELLLSSLQRCGILADQAYNGVKLVLGGELLTLLTNNADQEDTREELAIPEASAPLEIGFRLSYLVDALQTLKGEKTVRLAFSDAATAVVITVPGSTAFRCVVMPMRI